MTIRKETRISVFRGCGSHTCNRKFYLDKPGDNYYVGFIPLGWNFLLVRAVEIDERRGRGWNHNDTVSSARHGFFFFFSKSTTKKMEQRRWIEEISSTRLGYDNNQEWNNRLYIYIFTSCFSPVKRSFEIDFHICIYDFLSF